MSHKVLTMLWRGTLRERFVVGGRLQISKCFVNLVAVVVVVFPCIVEPTWMSPYLFILPSSWNTQIYVDDVIEERESSYECGIGTSSLCCTLRLWRLPYKRCRGCSKQWHSRLQTFSNFKMDIYSRENSKRFCCPSRRVMLQLRCCVQDRNIEKVWEQIRDRGFYFLRRMEKVKVQSHFICSQKTAGLLPSWRHLLLTFVFVLQVLFPVDVAGYRHGMSIFLCLDVSGHYVLLRTILSLFAAQLPTAFHFILSKWHETNKPEMWRSGLPLVVQ